ncbi:hypothetical protein GGF44_005387 [Coemansia sp. RSA 1694]|nr:hypothetical protein GGH95_005103 [Coemansia sp. RSA 1836]KAJ2622451.1 hypothetical protein GGF44_005387 [Coemansia sp. RSA 1694]
MHSLTSLVVVVTVTLMLLCSSGTLAAAVDLDPSHPEAALGWFSEHQLLRHDYPCNVVWISAGSLIVALIAITVVYERQQKQQAEAAAATAASPESEKALLAV